MTELVIRLLLIYLKGRNVSTQLRETGKRALLRQVALELGRAHHSARENRRGPGESLAVFSSNDGCRAIVRHGGAEFHSGKGVFSAAGDKKNLSELPLHEGNWILTALITHFCPVSLRLTTSPACTGPSSDF